MTPRAWDVFSPVGDSRYTEVEGSSRADLLEIARLGCEHLAIDVDEVSLAMFATEATGSPTLMRSICRSMCVQQEVLERCDPPRTLRIEAGDREAIMLWTSVPLDFRPLVEALVRKSRNRDVRRMLRVLAADPARRSFTSTELMHRLDEPDRASVVRACKACCRIAEESQSPPPLSWDARNDVLGLSADFRFYLR